MEIDVPWRWIRKQCYREQTHMCIGPQTIKSPAYLRSKAGVDRTISVGEPYGNLLLARLNRPGNVTKAWRSKMKTRLFP